MTNSVRFLALLLLLALPLNRSGQVPRVEAQTAPAVSVNPTSGPPGTLISVSAVSFPRSDVNVSASILFDAIVINRHSLVLCTQPVGSTGFGTACNGVAVTVEVPPGAAPGSHTVTVSEGTQQARTVFTVVSAPTATPSPTATPLPTPARTVAPTPTPTPGSTGTLPPAPACTPSGRGIFNSLGVLAQQARIPGGETVALTASHLTPGIRVILLYSGPRVQTHGTLAEQLDYSASLGRATVDAQGNLNVSVRLPDDAGFGTAHVEAFALTSPRTAPVMQWDVPVTPHAPRLQVTGTPGQRVVVSNGPVQLATPGACSLTLNGQGAGSTDLPPGGITVGWISPNGSLVETVPFLLPGTVTVVDTTQSTPATLSLPVCDAKLHVQFVYDNLSGTSTAMSGGGGFGYFLSGIPVDDTILVSMGTNDGSPISATCFLSLGADLLTPDFKVAQHVDPVSASSPAAAEAFLNTSLLPLASALVSFGNPSLLIQAIHALVVTNSASSASFLIHINPGTLPPGQGLLRLSFAGQPVFFSTVKIINSHWMTSPFLSLVSSPTFNPTTRTYQASSLAPPSPPSYDYSWKNPGPGWSKHGPIPAFHYPITNEVSARLLINDAFTTSGHWNSGGLLTLVLTIMNQKYGGAAKVYTSNRDPEYPDHYAAFETTVFGPSNIAHATWGIGGHIPVADVDVGLLLVFDLTGTVGAEVTSDFDPAIGNRGDLGLYGTGTLDWFAGGEASIGIAGLAAGLKGQLKLSVGERVTPDGTTPTACFGGKVNFVVSYAYNLGFTSGTGDIYGPIDITTFQYGTCSLFRRAVRLHQTATPVAVRPPSPTMSFDPAGHGMVAWVKSDTASHRDTLYMASNSARGWQRPVAVSRSAMGIFTPHVAELGDGRAVAAWVQNLSTPAQLAATSRLPAEARLTTLLRHNVIMTSLYDGARWSVPVSLSHANEFETDPSLAADPTRHTAMLVWSRIRGKDDNTLEYSRFDGSRWSSPGNVDGSANLLGRSPSLAARDGSYMLAWVGGPFATGTTRLSTFGAHGWAAQPGPDFPAGTQTVSLVSDRFGLVEAAAVSPHRGKYVNSVQQAIVASRQTAGGWRTKRVAALGNDPILTSDGGDHTILVFTRRDSRDPAGGATQIAQSVATSSGFTSVGLVTGQARHSALGAAAIDPARHTVRILAQRTAGTGSAPTEPDWARALNPKWSNLDKSQKLQGVTLALKPHVLLDLHNASLSDPHPTPGQQVTVAIPLRNNGLAPATVKGTVTVRGGTSVLKRTTISRRLLPGASSTVRIAVTDPATPISLEATGVKATPAVDLGIPASPTEVGASSAPNGAFLVTWTAPAQRDVSEYRVYRSVSNAPFELIGLASSTSYVDSDLQGLDPKAVRYAVTAVDGHGRESATSVAAKLSKSTRQSR